MCSWYLCILLHVKTPRLMRMLCLTLVRRGKKISFVMVVFSKYSWWTSPRESKKGMSITLAVDLDLFAT